MKEADSVEPEKVSDMLKRTFEANSDIKNKLKVRRRVEVIIVKRLISKLLLKVCIAVVLRL